MCNSHELECLYHRFSDITFSVILYIYIDLFSTNILN